MSRKRERAGAETPAPSDKPDMNAEYVTEPGANVNSIVTDEMLKHAAQGALARGMSIKSLRALTKVYAGDGKIYDCPTDKRQILFDTLRMSTDTANVEDAIPLFRKVAKVVQGTQGVLVLVGLHHIEENKPLTHQIATDTDADTITTKLIEAFDDIASHPGYSAHLAPAIYRADLPQWSKGKASDVITMLGFGVEFDKKHTPATRHQRLPVAPWCEIESSPGNWHCWYFFDKPYPPADVAPIVGAFLRAVGADATGNLDHTFRCPGSTNTPTKQKLKNGARAPGTVRALPHYIDPDLADIVAPPLTLQ